MFPSLFAVNWYGTPHIAIGAIIAFVIVAFFHKTHNSILVSIVAYLVICFILWGLGDWMFGAYQLPSTHEMPTY
jgi:hypothetical protein